MNNGVTVIFFTTLQFNIARTYFVRIIKSHMDKFSPVFNDTFVELVAERAKPGYTNLAYHNFGHAMRTFEASRRLVAQCYNAGVSVDTDVTTAAAFFHDYGFYEPLDNELHDSKEARSAEHAAHLLNDTHISKQQMQHIKKCILATHVDASCESVEETITVRADIENVSGNFFWFLLSFVRLQHERIQLNPVSVISVQNTIDSAEYILKKYLLDRDIALPGDTSSPFEPMHRNIKQLRKLSHETLKHAFTKFTH